ncbi:MAG: copper chaperone PCu(A)C [Acetobacteraceae bacterium]|nr:copper chaperone PCu(A)C [Acetobacteraceae bacterium]
MRTHTALLLSLPLLLTAGGAAFAAPNAATARAEVHGPVVLAADTAGITLETIWARPSMGAANSSAAYFTITDTGAPDRLVGVSTPAAAMAELHESIDDHGVMRMRGVAGVVLEQGKPVSFAPGGYHVMLMGLTQPLKPGDSFPLTLRFEHAAPLTVTVTVQTGPAGGAMQGHGMPMGHDMPMGTNTPMGTGMPMGQHPGAGQTN